MANLNLRALINTGDSELDDMLYESSKSTLMFARMFFPDQFSKHPAQMHLELCRFLDEDPAPHKCVIMPRGCGKSSWVQLAWIGRLTCFAHVIEKQDTRPHFILPISKSHGLAKEWSSTLRHQIEENELLRGIFGDLKSNNWAEDHWATSNGVLNLPRGAGQQVRGQNFRGHRPTHILMDDIEDDELVRSDDRRAQLRDWVYQAVMNCVDLGGYFQILAIANVIHEDCLVERLARSGLWEVLRFSIGETQSDGTFKSNWPEHMSDEKLTALYTHFKDIGKLGAFYRELMNDPAPVEEALFRQEYFHEYSDAEANLSADPKVETIILVDPAKTKTKDACDTAIVGVGISTLGNRIYIRDIDAGKKSPSEIIEHACKMADGLRAVAIAVEVTGLDDFISQPFKNYLSVTGRTNLEFIELKARGDKDDRIEGLHDYYRRGWVWHNKGTCAMLEQQLLSHPRGQKKDVADATAYAVKLMEEGSRYFSPALVEKMEGYTKEEVEAEYAGLEQEYLQEMGPLPPMRDIC